ncbi:MAG: FeoB small GTPase domain-containing protein, partial [Aeromonas sp.]
MKMNIVTVGNPNSGKTSLFNALTGARQHVGNWSGVTVEKKSGYFEHQGTEVTLVDLPGIYGLGNQDDSIDEQIASRYVQAQRPDLFLNVIDASSLERSLYLTLQLRELGLPVLVVLNKIDILEKRRIEIDIDALSSALGCPVIALSSRNRRQVLALKNKMIGIAGAQLPLSLD